MPSRIVDIAVACSAAADVVTVAMGGPPSASAQNAGSCVVTSVPARSADCGLIGPSMTATVTPVPVVRWWMSAMPVWL